MGLFGALFAGVSGLDSQSNKIGIISNNISNVNTVGFKQGQAAFDTLVVPSGTTNFSPGGVIGNTQQLVNQQGLIQATSSPTDVAITGNGFFNVNTAADGTGTSLLTRAGSFTQDSSGNFVNADGLFLQGIPITTPPTSVNATNLKTVNVNQNATGSATATTAVTLAANFDASQAVLPGSGETATLAGDTINASNTASQIIVPTAANGIKRGDSFVIQPANAGTSNTFIYGGFSVGRNITASLDTSAATATTDGVSATGDGGQVMDQETVPAMDISNTGAYTISVTVSGVNGANYTYPGGIITLSGASDIGGIPASQINGTHSITGITSSAAPVAHFTASASGDLRSGDTFTIDNHNITFGPSGQVALGGTLSATLTNLKNYLNGAGYTDLAGVTFSSTGTQLEALYTGSTPPTVTTSYANAPAPTATPGSGTVATASTVTTFSGSAAFGVGDTYSITVGTQTVSLTAVATGATQGASFDIGNSETQTLQNIAAAFSPANLSTLGLSSVSSTGTTINAVSSSGSLANVTATYTPSTAPTLSNNSSVTVGGGATAIGTFTGNDNFHVGDTYTVTNGSNSVTLTAVATGAVQGTSFDIGNTETATLQNIAAGFTSNQITGTLGLTTITSTATSIQATASGSPTVSSSYAAATPPTANAGSGTVAPASTLDTFSASNAFQIGDTYTLSTTGGSVTLTAVANGHTPAAGQFAIGTSEGQTLANIAAAFTNTNLNTLGFSSIGVSGDSLTAVAASTSQSVAATYTPTSVTFSGGSTALLDGGNTTITFATTTAGTGMGSTSSTAATVNNRTYAFTGNILNATTAAGDMLANITPATVFTTGALQFKIETSAGTTSTFTYNAQPDPTQGQFNSLNSLVTAIDEASSNTLTASVVNGQLYVSPTDATQGMTFSNVDPSGSGTLAGINWLQELGLPLSTPAVANNTTYRFNTLNGLANEVNLAAPSSLIATVNNPTGASTVTIDAADPTSSITFSDGSANAGSSLLNALGFVGYKGAALSPAANTGGGTSLTTTLPLTYSAGSTTTDMSSGAVTPQFTKDFTIYDSLGNAHTVALNVLKLDVNTWAVELTAVPASSVTSPTGDGQIAAAKITFNGDGTLASITSQTGQGGVSNLADAVTINWTQTGPNAVGASQSTINFNLGTDGKSNGLSQSAAAFNVSTANQNGSPIGQLTGVSIDQDGLVIETFSNGQTQQVFQVPLANVSNPDGLEAVSGDAYQQTLASGQVSLNTPGNGGTGTITPSALEQSNVDLSTQLTNLIVAQQAYGANSKVLTIADQLLQELDQIIQ